MYLNWHLELEHAINTGLFLLAAEGSRISDLDPAALIKASIKCGTDGVPAQGVVQTNFTIVLRPKGCLQGTVKEKSDDA